MRSERCCKFSCLVLLVLIALSSRAFSSDTYVVVGPTYNCVGHYAWVKTINQALAAVKGATYAVIDVCPGTYTEQVVISQSLTLIGVKGGSQNAAVIVPPTTGVVANTVDVDTGNPIAAQILVQNTAGPVSITNLTVDGTGNQISGCSPDLHGILFQNASGTVDHVAVRNQIPAGVPSGCQIGEGIFVQTATGFTSTVTVETSSVHNYNKNGITGNDPGTKLTATGSYIQGAGVVPSGGAAQNGIQLGYGATGQISLNTVIDNIYGDPTVAASADILLYDTAESSGITVTSNVLGNSQLPIGLETDFAYGASEYGDGVTVTTNKIFGTSTYDAIDVCTNGNTVTKNTIYNSAQSGVHFDDSCSVYYSGPATGENNTATGNTILESACAGILDDWAGAGGNTYGTETYYTVPFPVANDATSCVLPGAGPAHPKTAYKFSPKK
ncbi:MAG: hypothetical protein WCA13_13380 [Terriglobales bacterium]